MKLTHSKNIETANSHHSSFFQIGSNDKFFDKANKPFFNASPIQAKLTVNQPNDPYEIEADAMADIVVQSLNNPAFIHSDNNPNQVFSNSSIQRECTACKHEDESENKKIRKSPVNILQKQPIGGPALASNPAANSSTLPANVVQQWQSHLAAGNLLLATNVIVGEMIRRGEIDPSLYRVQQTSTGSTACQGTNPQLIIITSMVNGANTQHCPCVSINSLKYANPRVSIHPDLVQFITLGSTTPQTNATVLHSTLLHEFRHIRQLYEECNTAGVVVSSGTCTDCNNPEEMDAYLAEIEAGYDRIAIRNAWVRVFVNWNYLSPTQQNVFLTRKQAASVKVNSLYPGVTWNTNHSVLVYQQWCQSIQGGAVGTCSSFMAPLSQGAPQTGAAPPLSNSK